MSVLPIGTSTSQTSQSLASQLVQDLLHPGTSAQDISSGSSLSGDLMTLSPAAQQLQQAPSAVVEAMSDIFSGQKDVPGDLAKLKAYFRENPQKLTTLLENLRGSLGTYSPSGTADSKQAMLAALLNGQNNGSGAVNPVSLLMGLSSQDTLFTFMGGSGTGSTNGPVSILG
ncbi:MAG TPA: hypothetical protein VJ486_04910 [Geothrix sp.]|nr:hypothetical protein [Geothrix sp.]